MKKTILGILICSMFVSACGKEEINPNVIEQKFKKQGWQIEFKPSLTSTKNKFEPNSYEVIISKEDTENKIIEQSIYVESVILTKDGEIYWDDEKDVISNLDYKVRTKDEGNERDVYLEFYDGMSDEQMGSVYNVVWTDTINIEEQCQIIYDRTYQSYTDRFPKCNKEQTKVLKADQQEAEKQLNKEFKKVGITKEEFYEWLEPYIKQMQRKYINNR